MAEEEKKQQRYVGVPVSEKNYNFLQVLNERTRRKFDKMLRDRAIVLVEKLRRGVKI